MYEMLIWSILETMPPTRRYCHLTGTITKSLKGYSTILSTQLPLANGEYAKTNEFHELGSAVSLHLQ